MPAFALAEIAFLVSLTSADKGVSQLAAQGLRHIAKAEQQPGSPNNPGVTMEERSRRHSIYEQIGDPNVIVVGKYLICVVRLFCILMVCRACRSAETIEEARPLHSTSCTELYCGLGGMLLEMALSMRICCAVSIGPYCLT